LLIKVKIQYDLLLAVVIFYFLGWSNFLGASDTERAETIGYYTAGCIKNSALLPRDGIGYQVIRLSRDRFYGHPELINYITSLSELVANLYGGALLI